MENNKNITAALSMESWYVEAISTLTAALKICLQKGMPQDLAVDILMEITRTATRKAVKCDFEKDVVIKVDSHNFDVKQLAEELEFYRTSKILNNIL